MEKSIDVSKDPLLAFVASSRARESRQRMDQCDIQCHWYQYFATDSFISLRDGFSALQPYVSDILRLN